MKKMIAIVLAGYLVIGLLACGAKEVSDDGAGAATEAVQSTSLTEDTINSRNRCWHFPFY